MAYTFFPESTAEIKKKLTGTANELKLKEIVAIFEECKKQTPASLKSELKAPINIDPAALRGVNISRNLDGYVNLSTLKTKLRLNSTTIKFGNGSSGNRGVKNRGNLFEPAYARAIENWYSGETTGIDGTFLPSIMDLNKTYNLKKYKNLTVKQVGELNNRRPLIFNSSPFISSQIPTKGLDLGPIVTDLTIMDGEKEKVYLSLKLGGTTTFFNIGIKTILPRNDIENNKLQGNGKKFVKMFNVRENLFCNIFNGVLKKGYKEDVWPKMTASQKAELERFLQSGIGFGYHVIHKTGGSIKSIVIDEKYMKSAAKPMSCIAYYGGKTGTGKRIDFEIITGKYILKLNIRDTQGGDGYPTRIMGDFSYK